MREFFEWAFVWGDVNPHDGGLGAGEPDGCTVVVEVRATALFGAMRGGAVAGGRRRGSPPDGTSCSRHAGLQQCKSFVEMCIVSCLSAAPACVCGRVAATWGCTRCRLPCRRDSPDPLMMMPFNCSYRNKNLQHQRWLVVVWLAVVSSADGLYAVDLWRGCRGTSVSAWGPYWPPMPRPRLLLQRPTGEGGVGFP